MWGKPSESCCTLPQKTLRFNGLWSGETFPAVGALPSQQILFQEASSPSSPARQSSQRHIDSSPALWMMGAEALIGDLKT